MTVAFRFARNVNPLTILIYELIELNARFSDLLYSVGYAHTRHTEITGVAFHVIRGFRAANQCVYGKRSEYRVRDNGDTE